MDWALEITITKEALQMDVTRETRVAEATYNEALKLIYMWVRQGVIQLTEFKKLIQVNRDSIY